MRTLAYACIAAILPGLALADGIPTAGRYAAPVSATRNVSCYVGAAASGAFVRDGEAVSTLMDLRQGDALVGVTPSIGCDLLTSSFVLGFFGDYTFQSAKTVSSLAGLNMTVPWGDEYTIGARLGVWTHPIHHTLLYITGGYVGALTNNVTIAGLPVALSGPRGAMVGGGIETVLLADNTSPNSPAWDGFIEYRHEFFGDRSGMLASVLPTSVSTSEDKVLVGIKRRF